MPMSVDTDKLTEELPRLMQQAIEKSAGENLRRDETLPPLRPDRGHDKGGRGRTLLDRGWGDVVLFASSQVPIAERDVWNPPFQQVMASLQITRDDQLLLRQVANEVLSRLRQRFPEEEYEYDADKIRGRHRVVYLSNLLREVRAEPASRREKIISHFVETAPTSPRRPTSAMKSGTRSASRSCPF